MTTSNNIPNDVKVQIAAIIQSGVDLWRGYDLLINYVATSDPRYFWLKQASLINRMANGVDIPIDSNSSSVFIITASQYSLALDGKDISVVGTSNAIAVNVLNDFASEAGDISIDQIIKNDAILAVTTGGQTIGGWGGAFYYWDMDLSVVNGEVQTVGQAILSDPMEYEKFLAANTASVLAVMSQQWKDAFSIESFSEYIGSSQESLNVLIAGLGAQVPFEIRGEIIGRVISAATLGSSGDITGGNVVDGWSYVEDTGEFYVVIPNLDGSSNTLVATGAEHVELKARWDARQVIKANGMGDTSVVSQVLGRDIFNAECFAADTQILLADGSYKTIQDIHIGDLVMAFDPKQPSIQVSKKVTQLFRGETKKWLKISSHEFSQDMNVTPNHPMLTKNGTFSSLVDLINKQTNEVELIDKNGKVVLGRVEEIAYSTKTADLFERSQLYITSGSSAIKPQVAENWQTYNFEVEDLHTYIANDVCVHNNCEIHTVHQTTLDAYVAAGLIGEGTGYFAVKGPDGTYLILSKTGQTVKLGDFEGQALTDVFEVIQDVVEHVSNAVDDTLLDLPTYLTNLAPGFILDLVNGGDLDETAEIYAKQLAIQMGADALFKMFNLESIGKADWNNPLFFETEVGAALKGALVRMAVMAALHGENVGAADYIELARNESIKFAVTQVLQTQQWAIGTLPAQDLFDIEGFAGSTPLSDVGLAAAAGAVSLFIGLLDHGLENLEVTIAEAAIAAASSYIGSAAGAAINTALGTVGGPIGLIVGSVIGGLVGNFLTDIFIPPPKFIIQTNDDGTLTVIVNPEAGGNAYTARDGFDDTLIGHKGNDTLHGGNGDNTILGLAGDDYITGAEGDDTLIGGIGHDTMVGGEGNDKLFGGDGNDVIYGDSLADEETSAFVQNAAVQTLGDVGTYVNEESSGSGDVDEVTEEIFDANATHNDIILAGAGNDKVYAGKGDDYVEGGFGSDIIFGQEGDDVIDGGAQDDAIYDDLGDNVVIGGAGNDLIETGAGDDLIYGDQSIKLRDTAVTTSIRSWLNGTAAFSDQLKVLLGVHLVYQSEEAVIASRIGEDTDDPSFWDMVVDFFQGFLGIDYYNENGVPVINPAAVYNFYNGEAADVYRPFLGAYTLEEVLLQSFDVIETELSDYLVAAMVGPAEQSELLTAYLTWVEANDASLHTQIINNEFDYLLDLPDDPENSPEEIPILTVDLGEGNDIISSGAGIDIIYGGRGNDTINGDAGNDAIYGGEGDDKITAGAGNDIVSGDEGNDVIYGSAGSDILNGNDGNDGIFGGADDDIINGDAGDDLLEGGLGNDVISGGEGNDTISGNAGNDSISGGSGEDYIAAGEGDDLVFGGNDNDVISGGVGDDLLLGEIGNDTLFGGDGDDSLIGGAGNDILDGGTGVDEISGGSGDDRINGGSGADIIDGEDGEDIVLFDTATAGVSVDLNLSAGSAGDALGDTYTSIENIAGSDFDDELRGDNGVNKIWGAAGNDQIFGHGGNDSLYGGDGEDVLYGGAGVDSYVGGAGHDRVSFKESLNAVTASIATEVADINGTVETFTEIEGLIGSDFDDTLLGADNDNSLEGGFGNDYLSGGNGNDVYAYGQNYGEDVVFDNRSHVGIASIDKVVFNSDISPSDLTLTKVGDDLEITFLNLTDKLTIQKQFAWGGLGYGSYDEIETFEFSDGTVWDANYIRVTLLQGTDGDDISIGFHTPDIFLNSLGDDLLSGRDGDDVYHYNIGDGTDTIDENVKIVSYSNTDKILFGDLISPGDVEFSHDGNNLTISFVGSADQLIVLNQYSYGGLGYGSYDEIESYEFYDGTVWTAANVREKLLEATDGDDYLLGFHTADTLAGGLGDDTLVGRDGDDTYVYNLGDGDDIVEEKIKIVSYSNDDKIVLGAGITLENIITATTAKDIIITFTGQPGSLTIKDQFSHSYKFIEEYHFDNGEVLSRDDLLNINNIASAGDEVLIGRTMNDQLEAGLGDDIIKTKKGIDTVIYNLADGNDLLFVSDANDKLMLNGILPEDVVIHRDADNLDNLVIEFSNGQQITVQDHFAGVSSELGSIEFGNGVVWGHDEIITAYLVNASTDGADIIVGTNDNNTFNSGLGDDIVDTAGGFNTITYSLGDGNDNYELHDQDDLLMLHNVLPGDVSVKLPNDNGTKLVLVLPDGSEITFSGDFENNYKILDKIIFDNGDEWSHEEIIGHFVNTISTSGSDIIRGGVNAAGVISGGDGSDVYLFAQGDGAQIIEENGFNDTDQLMIIGYDSDDVLVHRVTVGSVENMVISFTGTSDTITIVNAFNDVHYDQIEEFVFDDGTVWTIDEVRTQVISSFGTDGDDIINGFKFSDVIEGGLGNDELHGQKGSDVYVFTQGDGQDIIEDNGFNGTDQLVIHGYDIGQVQVQNVVADGVDNLFISFDGTSDTITIVNGFNDAHYDQIEEFIFDDGTVWTIDEVRAKVVISLKTDGDDVINGFAFGDVIEGGLGNDELHGRDGSDIYVFTRGDGQDTIEDNGFNDTDQLVIHGYLPNELVAQNVNGTDLLLTFVGTDDSVTIINTLNDVHYDQIEEFIFDDGTALSIQDMKDLIVRPPDVGAVDLGQMLEDGSMVITQSDLLINSTDVDGDDLTVSALSIANTIGNIVDNGNDSWTFTPVENFNADEIEFSFTVFDGLEATDATAILNVISTNDLPIAANLDNISLDEDHEIVILASDILANDIDVDGDTLSIISVQDATFGSVLLNNDGNVLFSPLPNYNGNASFSYTISDGNGGESTASVLLNVHSVNDVAIVSNVDLGQIDEDGILIITRTQLLANSSDVDGDALIVSSLDLVAAVGSLVDNGDDTWTFSPNENYNGDDVEFLFTVSDGTTIVDATAVLDVASINDGPTAVADSNFVTDEDVPLTILASELISNDTDVEGDTVSLISVQGALNGSVALDVNGDVTFTPDNGYDGLASFSYTISDGNGGDGTASVTLNVNAQSNDPTSGDDNLIGSSLDDTISALAGNDTIIGLAGDDVINAGSGNDVIEGGLGDDTLNGSSGSDVYYYSSGDGNDFLDDDHYSTSQIDRLIFRDLNIVDIKLSHTGKDLFIEILSTGEVIQVDDQFSSASYHYGLEEIEFSDGTIWVRAEIHAQSIIQMQTSGDDIVNGTKESDVIEGGLGDDTLNGSSGSDVYYYSNGDGNDFLDDDHYSTSQIDRLIFRDINAVDIKLSHTGKDLFIEILSTGEVIQVDDQFSSASYHYGLEEIIFGDGIVWTRSDIAAQIITGSGSAETLNGTANNDTISGLAGDDILNGNDGNDLLIGGEGADILDGGTGTDTASYEDSNSGVYVHMLDVAQNTGDALGDTFNSIENLKGSDYDDTLIATDDDNFIWGDNGDDTILGLDGDDTIYGRVGDDQLYGNEGNDVLAGGNGADSIFGGVGDDRIDLGDGDDFAMGGTGNDTFVFRSSLGNDYIGDFQGGAGAGDVIELQGMGISSYAQLQTYMSEWNGTTHIDFDASNSITLEGVSMASLDADDFNFV
ncbi:MAG: cadherin-like domain-containing protein [Hyphomicrobiales bacterium]